MPDISQISNDQIQNEEPNIYGGTIGETAQHLSDEVHVIIPAIDAHAKHGTCKWMPRATADGVQFPHKGDPCIVGITEDDDPWIIGWWTTRGAVDDAF